ncbi:hypothetical protein MMC10_000303 [Thelotrema lepadinum]|nr:hypothetical protein [Thelotrema lepadinum]
MPDGNQCAPLKLRVTRAADLLPLCLLKRPSAVILENEQMARLLLAAEYANNGESGPFSRLMQWALDLPSRTKDVMDKIDREYFQLLSGVELPGSKLENFRKVSDEYSLGRCSTGDKFDLSALPRPLSVSTRKSSPEKDASMSEDDMLFKTLQNCRSESPESYDFTTHLEQDKPLNCADHSRMENKAGSSSKISKTRNVVTKNTTVRTPSLVRMSHETTPPSRELVTPRTSDIDWAGVEEAVDRAYPPVMDQLVTNVEHVPANPAKSSKDGRKRSRIPKHRANRNLNTEPKSLPDPFESPAREHTGYQETTQSPPVASSSTKRSPKAVPNYPPLPVPPVPARSARRNSIYPSTGEGGEHIPELHTGHTSTSASTAKSVGEPIPELHDGHTSTYASTANSVGEPIPKLLAERAPASHIAAKNVEGSKPASHSKSKSSLVFSTPSRASRVGFERLVKDSRIQALDAEMEDRVFSRRQDLRLSISRTWPCRNESQHMAVQLVNFSSVEDLASPTDPIIKTQSLPTPREGMDHSTSQSISPMRIGDSFTRRTIEKSSGLIATHPSMIARLINLHSPSDEAMFNRRPTASEFLKSMAHPHLEIDRQGLENRKELIRMHTLAKVEEHEAAEEEKEAAAKKASSRKRSLIPLRVRFSPSSPQVVPVKNISATSSKTKTGLFNRSKPE